MAELNEAMRREGFVPAAEAADEAGVSVYTIYNWITAGKVKGTRAAAHWYVDHDSLVKHVGKEALEAVRKMRRAEARQQGS